ncbi:chemotaxis protein MotB [Gammaproteobacteria bacterium]
MNETPPPHLGISPPVPAGRPDSPTEEKSADAAQDLTGQRALDLISKEIGENLGSFMDKDLITVRRDKLWLEVEIKTSILFPSGSAALEQTAQPILSKVAEILKNFPNPVQVGGFTDDRPINSVAYPSNWELSAGRAASVVHLFNKLGMKPERMAAVGYGEYRPTADNATPEGRNKNRRVVLQILAQPEMRRASEVEPGAAKAN